MTDREYKQLVALHEKYQTHGLEILAFPCNQFGGQEPGTPEEIEAFVSKYNVQFNMMEKVDVNGSDAHPLFVYLKNKKPGMLAAIKWNFTEFLVDQQGEVVKRVEPATEVKALAPTIERLLGLTPSEGSTSNAKK